MSDFDTNSSVPQITGIILAAGKGERFGGDKCLARLPNGVAMGVAAASNLAQVVDELICVVRPQDELLQAELLKAGLKIVICQDADAGMSASLREGIKASPSASGWIIALADMPLIKPSTYQAIVTEAIKQTKDLKHTEAIKQDQTVSATQQPIIVPSYQGQDGHPVYFPARFRDELLALSGDRGAKKLLHQYPESVQRTALEDAGILKDFDTRADFEAFNFSGK
jgi:molybdenum cofactor cytidylyltransferase